MNQKNRTHSSVKQYVALTLAVLVLIVVSVFAVNNLAPNDVSEAPVTNEESESVATDSKTDSETSKSYITYEATTNGSALDQLQAMNDTVVVEESDLGKYVESINGLVGGTDGRYWSFYVDGELAEVGADAYELNGGEVIEWKFQKL